ncbi:MAG: glycosyltransferase family 39 protein [Planctomycetota bacterium]
MRDDARAPRWLFWCAVVLHVLLWTLLPSLLRYVTPTDATEGAVWGRHLALGYPRNPWLGAWLTRLALTLSGNRDASIYLLSQLCVLVTFWSVWRLGRELFSAWHALVGVLMLEGAQYYSIAIIDFADNTLLLALWSLSALLLYLAVKTQCLRCWLLLGLTCGLGMMAKYQTALVFPPMLFFLLADSQARASLRRPGLYWGVAVLALICVPHAVWLFSHDFITVRYAFTRLEQPAEPWWVEHLQYPGRFALNQLLTFAGPAVLYSFLCWGKKGRTLGEPAELAGFERRFLWIIGVGPFLLTVLLSLALGWYLRTMWGIPFLSLWGLLLAGVLPQKITTVTVRRFSIAVLIVFVGLAAGYVLALEERGVRRSANYPLREVADEVTREWHARYGTPLECVAGERLIVSYVARYSPDHPAALIDFDSEKSPWLDPDDLHRAGAVFVQFVNYRRGKPEFPPAVRERFPGLQVEPPRAYAWHRSLPGQDPLEILVGYLPPAFVHARPKRRGR